MLSFCLGGSSEFEDVLSEIALLDVIFKVTCRGTGIEKFGIPYYRGRNSSLSLQDEQSPVFSPPDA